MLRALFTAAVFVTSALPAVAQDAVKVDPKHYKVELENDQVRVLRITYGPHEKSVMHEHPASLAIFLTNANVSFTLPDGKTQDAQREAGAIEWNAGGKHLPENMSDVPFELILVEMKQRESSEEATEGQAAETVAGAATISLADIAGTWDMRAMPETGTDTTTTVYQVRATADGLTLFLPDRDPIETAVTTSGDSIIVDAGPFESVRRAGVMVRTHSTFRVEGDRLMGTTEAHYVTSDADSVLRLHVEGTRAP